VKPEKIEEKKLCKKGEAYRKRRMAAGEKSSAYLSGRAVKVCKGQMSGKKKKTNEAEGKAAPYGSGYERLDNAVEESLRDWFKKEDWVRINTSGNIAGKCGTMKKGKATTRCLPRAKASNMTKAERKATVAKKVRGSKKGKQFVSVNEGYEEIEPYYIIQSLRTGSPKYVANIEGEKPSWVRDSNINKAFKFNTLEDAKNYLSKFDPKRTEFWHIYKTPLGDYGLGPDLKEFVNYLREICVPENIKEAKYKGRTVTLNKPMRGDSKKFKVYVNSGKKNADGSIKVKKVNFGHGGTTAKKAGQKTMKIRKSNPKARAAFRARHNCDNPGPKTKARYWSCKKW
tara:strand:- start:776 stop:1798 length:1023 start_codon:yes stop_codon:yes gene_type:complete